MTLTNPFGVSRYLQPRRAGLIAYKGGGAAGAVTNITETGLGDTQFQTLQTNQSDIRGDITGLGTDVQTYGDALKTGQSGITNLIGSAASTDDDGLVTPASGLYGQFNDQYNYLTGLSDRMDTGFTDLTGNVNTQTSALASGQAGLASGQSGLVTGLGNLQDNVNTGLAGFTGRFDTIDQANTNMQTSVNEGFEDQAKGFTAVNANMASGFEDSQNTLNAGFEASNTAMNTGFSDAQSQLTNTQSNVLAGQQGLNTALDTMGNTADIYAAQSLENQANLQSGQDGFVSNFDNYVDRYTDDVNLANQFRTDLEEAQTNAFKGLREDVGNFAETASTANTGTQSAVDQLNQTITGGFRDASTDEQIAARKQTNDLNNIRDLLQTTGQSLDASTRDQYQKLADAFDQQGNLITQGIDDQGNTLRRELDAQGAVIETRFDQSGNQIGQFRMDVGQMISTANEFVSGQITDVGAATQARFDVQTGTMNTQGKSLLNLASQNNSLDQTVRNEFTAVASAFDDTGNLIGRSTDNLGNTIQRQIDQNGNLITTRFDQTGGLIDQSSSNIAKSIADANNAMQSGQTGLSSDINALGANLDQTSTGLMSQTGDIRNQITAGFNANNQTMDTQVRDMAKAISSIQDLDIARREDLSDLSQAFDDQGRLIRSTVAENGVTTARAIDANGNLMLRAFDATGNELGNKVVDINQQLNFLGEYGYLPGANTSMGNLSPAVNANNGGFASPFTQTR
jgi:hypothetical protein